MISVKNTKKIFLVLTGSKKHWPSDGNVVYLGAWCKVVDRKYNNENITKIINYHWDDKDKYYRDYLFCKKIYKKSLFSLAASLNKIHKTEYSVTYWEIIIGRWLKCFVETLWDRYECVIAAESELGNCVAVISDENRFNLSYPSFTSDEYNHYIFSKILLHRNIFELMIKNFDQVDQMENSYTYTQTSKVKILVFLIRKHLLSKPIGLFFKQLWGWLKINFGVLKYYLFKSHTMFLGTVYLPPGTFGRFARKIKTVNAEFHGFKVPSTTLVPNGLMREKLVLNGEDSDFERLLADLLPTEIPSIFVENYKEIDDFVSKSSPKPPKVIITQLTIFGRVYCDFMVARFKELYGSILVIAQHGGNYGTAKVNSMEDHFVDISDYYCTWGSKLGGHRKVSVLPGFRLFTSMVHRRNDANGPILVVGNTLPKYKHFIHSGITGPHFEAYIQLLDKFFDSLDFRLRDNLIWRNFGNLWGEDIYINGRHRWLSSQIAIRKELHGIGDFEAKVLASRVSIHTVNETTFLQTLSANLPTIVLWNKEYYEIRIDQTPYFDKLIEAKILFFDPELAAKHLLDVYDYIEEWWSKPDVQSSVKFFCDNLAFVVSEESELIQIWSDFVSNIQSAHLERKNV